jgi:hypothetical protein
VPRLPGQQPFHEPIGASDEDMRSSRRWIFTLIFAAAVLAAGVVASIRLA